MREGFGCPAPHEMDSSLESLGHQVEKKDASSVMPLSSGDAASPLQTAFQSQKGKKKKTVIRV